MRRFGKALKAGGEAFGKEHAKQKSLAANLKKRAKADLKKAIKYFPNSGIKLTARQKKIWHRYRAELARLSKEGLLTGKKLAAAEKSALKFAIGERTKWEAKLMAPRLKMREVNELIEIAIKEQIGIEHELRKSLEKNDAQKIMVYKKALGLVTADILRYTVQKGELLSSYAKMRKERKNE